MAPNSSTLAWKIPWTEEPGRLQSTGLLRVEHEWVISLSLSCIGEGNGNPLQCSCLENPRDGGAWWAAVYGVAQSQTPLKRLSSSSSRQSIKAKGPHWSTARQLWISATECKKSRYLNCIYIIGILFFAILLIFFNAGFHFCRSPKTIYWIWALGK